MNLVFCYFGITCLDAELEPATLASRLVVVSQRSSQKRRFRVSYFVFIGIKVLYYYIKFKNIGSISNNIIKVVY